MSSMLEQAIVDAKALREAALKNAEASIIEASAFLRAASLKAVASTIACSSIDDIYNSPNSVNKRHFMSKINSL